MGEVAAMILEGTLCRSCEIFIDSPPPDHPRDCEACKARHRPRGRDRNEPAPPGPAERK